MLRQVLTPLYLGRCPRHSALDTNPRRTTLTLARPRLLAAFTPPAPGAETNTNQPNELRRPGLRWRVGNPEPLETLSRWQH